MPLTPDEQRWCAWVESLPGLQRTAHNDAPTVSIPAFTAGVESERERILDAVLAWIDPKLAALKTRNAGSRVDALTVHDSASIGLLSEIRRALVSICPASPKPGKEE